MLNSLNVLDLSRVLAGPLCGMTLGDLGANVIKVERPGVGDESRGWGPPFAPDGTSAYYLCCNRNKLSVALDFDSKSDLAVLRSLFSGADVVLENFRPGALEARGIAPEEILTLHPRLVWCTISGFGARNPRPGYDFVLQAEYGWMSVTGEPDGQPMKAGMALVDVITGKDAAISILSTLLARELAGESLTPERRRLNVALSRSAASALINVAQNVLVSGGDAGRWGNAHANLVPYDLFRASDRGLVIAVGNDHQWAGMCRALELEDLGADRALATNAGRLANRARVTGAIGERVATRTAAHWLGALERFGVPAGVVRQVKDVLDEVPCDARTGIAPQEPGTVRLTPPSLDEHGALIRSLGWGAFVSVGSGGG